ncbi:MAG: arylsulfotransferase family protein [Fluviicola sp.]
MKRYFFTLAIVIFNYIGYSQNFNRPVPQNVFQYEYNEPVGISSGYMLATHVKMWSNANNDPNYIYPYAGVYDSDGYLLWYGSPEVNGLADFKYYPATDQYTFTMRSPLLMQSVLLNNQFEPIDTLTTINNEQDIHDIQLLDNGNWMISTITWDTMDLSAFTFDGTQGSTQTIVRGYGYEEIDANGNVINEWDSNDHIDVNETLDYWGYDPNNFDYCHGNAFEEDTDGNFLASYRHLNSIHKINRQTGAIMWRLGGEQSDFTFVNDSGFSGQHDMRRLPNGDISLFDNANMGTESRGVTYQLDTTNWIATKTSEFLYPGGLNATAMGSYRVNDNGTEILGYGRIQRPDPNCVIIDANDNILAEYYFRDSVVSYRTILADINPPQRPEIVCEFNGTDLTLSVTTAHNNYAWSTGELTSTITISQPGTYQVWVDQGMGMIGSLPLVVNDLSTAPCLVGIEELTLEKGSFRWCNVLGQEVKHLENGRLYLKVYESGAIEKIIYQN